MWVAAFVCTLWKRRSTSGMLAWTSSTSSAVPLMPPVINLDTWPWMEWRSFIGPTDPHELLLWATLNGGTYHTSEA